MKTLWLKAWDYLRLSLWFVPTVMTLAAVAAAFGAVALDERMTTEWLEQLGWRYTGGAEGASLMLSTLAGSSARGSAGMVTSGRTFVGLLDTALSVRLLPENCRSAVS